MKGLFLKEFYQWLKTRSVFTALYVTLFVVLIYTSEGSLRTMPTGLFGVVCALALNSFMLDEKSGWSEYSKALPYSPFQRVTVKYIFLSPELMLVCFAEMINAVIPQRITELYINSSPLGGYPEAVVSFALWIIGISISLPFCILTKGNKRYALSCIPLFLTLAASMLAASKLRNSVTPEWLSDVTALKWFYPAVIFACIGIFIASWLITVAIEARGDKKYSLKFLKIAVVPIVVAVALGAVIGNALYSNHDFIEEKTMRDSKGYKYISDIDEIWDEYNNYYSSYSGGFSLGLSVSECADNLKEIGFIQNVYSPQKLYSESGKINVNLTTDEQTEKIISVFAYCNLAEKVIDNATDNDFADIISNFNTGMTEADLLLKFEELTLFPCDIQECFSGDNQPCRIYTLRFSTSNHNKRFDSAATFKLTITTNGKNVTEITPRLFKHYEDERDDTVNPYPEETPLEVATYEMKAFISGFCNETHMEESPRECVKKLRAIDYSESDETDDLFYSQNGKVSVMLTVNDEEKIEKITAIINYGELRYIESATDKDMDEIFGNFVLGMPESDFQQKFLELDALPESVTESLNEKNEHLRTYKIRYRIGDFNGNGAITCIAEVDITDGKLTYIDIYYA